VSDLSSIKAHFSTYLHKYDVKFISLLPRWLQHFAFLKDLSFQFKAVRREFDASLKYVPPKKNSPLRSVLLFSGFRRRSGGLVLFSLSHQSIPSQIWLISIMVDAFQINYYYLINVVSSRMSKKAVVTPVTTGSKALSVVSRNWSFDFLFFFRIWRFIIAAINHYTTLKFRKLTAQYVQSDLNISRNDASARRDIDKDMRKKRSVISGYTQSGLCPLSNLIK
jgi:hypothetical protein